MQWLRVEFLPASGFATAAFGGELDANLQRLLDSNRIVAAQARVISDRVDGIFAS